MIIDINMSRKKALIGARKELYDRLALANEDKTAIADYLDYFDTRCVPLAIKSLPNKLKKRYEGKVADLINGLDSLEKKLGSDERKMYEHLNNCAYQFNQFLKGAYLGPESVSDEPIERLFRAEFSSTSARMIYNKLKPKYFIDSESEA